MLGFPSVVYKYLDVGGYGFIDTTIILGGFPYMLEPVGVFWNAGCARATQSSVFFLKKHPLPTLWVIC